MKKLILLAVLVLGVSGVAWARGMPTAKEEFIELAFETAECAAFYKVMDGCAPSDQLKKLAEHMLLISATISDEEVAASRFELCVKDIIKKTKDCSRIAIPVNSYGQKCRDIYEMIDKF